MAVLQPDNEQSTALPASDLQAFFEHAPTSMVVVLPDDPQFTIAAATDAYLAATGVRREEIVGHGMFEVFPDNPDDPATDGVHNLRASFRRAIATRNPDRMPLQRYDVERPTEGGFAECYLNPLNTPVLGADGRTAYIIHSVENVTEKVLSDKSMQAARLQLETSERRLRQVAETTGLGLIIADPGGGISYMNSAMRQLLGYDEEEVAAGLVRWDQLTPAEFGDRDAAALRDVLATGKCAPFEKVYIAKDGRRVPVLVGASLLESVNGRTEMAAFILDLTERKQSQKDAILVKLDDAVRPLTDSEEIMQTVARLLGQSLQADNVAYCSFEEDEETFEIRRDFTQPGVKSIVGRYQAAQLGQAFAQSIRANLPYVVEDIENDPGKAEVRATYRQLDVGACIAMPLHKAERLAAAMAVHQRTARRWLPDEIDLVHLIANRCWESIERARLQEDLRRAERRQAVLLKLMEGQRETSDPEAMMRAASEAVGNYLHVDRSGFFELLRNESLDFKGGWTAGRLPLLNGDFPAAGIGSLYLNEIRAGRTLGIGDARMDPLTADSQSEAIGAVALIVGPIIRNGRRHAGFYVNHAEPRAWPEEEISFVHEVGEQTWDAVERVRAEIALRKSEERLTFALDAGEGVGAWDWDIQSDLVHSNRRFAEFYSVDPSRAAAGAPIAEFLMGIHPSDRARMSDKVQEAIERGGDYAEEYRLARSDGEVRWIYCRGRVYRDEAGTPVRFPGVVFDITERKKAEAELRRQWNLFDTALSNTPDFTYIFNLEGRFTYVNRPLLDLLQRSLDETVGKNFFELEYPLELAERLQRQICEVINTQASVRDETPFTGPAGETRYYEYIFVPVFTGDGRVEAVAGSTRDITEHQQASAGLRQSNMDLARANRELEEFAYVASHDLQEPLRMVNIYTHLILRQLDLKDENLTQYAQFVQQGVVRMERLLRDLLTFSRTVHSEELSVGTADLSVSLGEAVAVLKKQIEESGAVISVEPLPTVQGETGQMAHVFQNLLSNALKYSRSEVKPTIHISSEQNGEEWIISVRDNGIGFSPRYSEHIFGLFKRLHREEYPGTGLGLAICQRIVERYGGRMWAEGRPGDGAKFFFALRQPQRIEDVADAN